MELKAVDFVTIEWDLIEIGLEMGSWDGLQLAAVSDALAANLAQLARARARAQLAARGGTAAVLKSRAPTRHDQRLALMMSGNVARTVPKRRSKGKGSGKGRGAKGRGRGGRGKAKAVPSARAKLKPKHAVVKAVAMPPCPPCPPAVVVGGGSSSNDPRPRGPGVGGIEAERAAWMDELFAAERAVAVARARAFGTGPNNPQPSRADYFERLPDRPRYTNRTDFKYVEAVVGRPAYDFMTVNFHSILYINDPRAYEHGYYYGAFYPYLTDTGEIDRGRFKRLEGVFPVGGGSHAHAKAIMECFNSQVSDAIVLMGVSVDAASIVSD